MYEANSHSPWMCTLPDGWCAAVRSKKEEHGAQLLAALEHILETEMTLNFTKCKFSKTCITILGHNIGQEGIRADTEHKLSKTWEPLQRSQSYTTFWKQWFAWENLLPSLVTWRSHWEHFSVRVLNGHGDLLDHMTWNQCSSWKRQEVETCSFVSCRMTSTEQHSAQVEKWPLQSVGHVKNLWIISLEKQSPLRQTMNPLPPSWLTNRIVVFLHEFFDATHYMHRFTYSIQHIPRKILNTTYTLLPTPLTSANFDHDLEEVA